MQVKFNNIGDKEYETCTCCILHNPVNGPQGGMVGDKLWYSIDPPYTLGHGKQCVHKTDKRSSYCFSCLHAKTTNIWSLTTVCVCIDSISLLF